MLMLRRDVAYFSPCHFFFAIRCRFTLPMLRLMRHAAALILPLRHYYAIRDAAMLRIL